MARKRRQLAPEVSEPLRWRIFREGNRAFCVLIKLAPPILGGQTVIWEGEAKHMLDAYRLARIAGVRVFLHKSKEFRVRD